MSYGCPICKTVYGEKISKCRCGFEGVDIAEYYPYFKSEAEKSEEYKKETFGIYKFTKRVACGELPYQPSEVVLQKRDNGDIGIYEAVEERGLAYIDCVGNDGKRTVADMGVVALRTGLHSMYLNTDYAESRFLDEAHIKMLFLGPDLKGFTDGFVVLTPPVRYVWVDPKNRFFTAENNVLFSKDKTVLVAYGRCRPEEEYKVPENVRYLEKYSFFFAENLRKLYLPRGIRIADGAFVQYGGEIIYY